MLGYIKWFLSLIARKHGKDYQMFYPAIRGYRKDCGIEFKSKMEANIYRYLTCDKEGSIIVKYEPDMFTFPKGSSPIGVERYVPDFKVTNGKYTHYIEVKGVETPVDVEKARLLRKHYPWVKLYFIYSKDYQRIEKEYSQLIPNWE